MRNKKTKPHIFYYSDCPFFAGCENMLSNFLQDTSFQSEFTLSFAYRYSKRYENGLLKHIVKNNYNKYPLRLISQFNYKEPKLRLKLFLLIHKIFYGFYILFHKYYSIIGNTIILYQFFKDKEIDILHVNNGGFPAAYSCYSAVIAGKLCGIKNIVYVVNNMAVSYLHPFRWFDLPIDFFIKRNVNIFITGSVNASERLGKVLSLGKNKRVAIPNAPKGGQVTVNRFDFLRSLDVEPNQLIITIPANLEERKGHIFLFKAIESLIKSNNTKSFICIVAGDGYLKEYLSDYIKNKGLYKNIKMVGHIDNVYNLLSATDIVVLPSIENEDFPNIIIESMYIGIPVIATKIAGIPEQIEDMETGILIPPKNEKELENALRYFIDNPTKMKRFSQAAKIRFEQNFTKDISMAKYKNLYLSLLKSKHENRASL